MPRQAMPRQARLDGPGVLHHVMGRDIEQGRIFRDDRDKEEFIRLLAEFASTVSICGI